MFFNMRENTPSTYSVDGGETLRVILLSSEIYLHPDCAPRPRFHSVEGSSNLVRTACYRSLEENRTGNLGIMPCMRC